MGLPRKALKAMFPRDKWHILRGDTVMVLAGREKGQLATVRRVIRDRKRPRVLLVDRNLGKKHVPRTKDSKGGIMSFEVPVHYSNVALVAPNEQGVQVPVRVNHKWLEDGTKVRVSAGKRTPQAIIPKPAAVLSHPKPVKPVAGPKDTNPTAAYEVTNDPAAAAAAPYMPQLLGHFRAAVPEGASREDGLRILDGMLDQRKRTLWAWQGFAARGLTGQKQRGSARTGSRE